MNFGDLKEELDKGIKRKLYIFTGEEREVMRVYIKRLEALESQSSQHALKHLKNQGLFQKHLSLVVFNDKAVLDKDPDSLINSIGSNTLILVYDEIDNRSKFFKYAKPYIFEFDKFTEEQLIGYIRKQLEMDPRLARILAMYCANDVARIDNEIHKLRHAAATITLDLVNEIVVPPTDNAIFQLATELCRRDVPKVWEIYHDLIELKTQPVQLVSILYTQFKQLLQVQTYAGLPFAQIQEKTGLNYYQVENAKKLMGRVHTDRLVEILRKIFDTEVKMKTSQVDHYIGIQDLLLSILNY